jgi:hypothetical protein
VSDGFSCREQVQQATPRTPLHLAEPCKMALDEAAAPTHDAFPERRHVTPRAPQSDLLLYLALGAAALAVLLVVLLH